MNTKANDSSGKSESSTASPVYKSIEWAYATSDNARAFGFYECGCWTVQLQEGQGAPRAIAGYKERSEAVAYALTLPNEWSELHKRWNKDHLTHCNLCNSLLESHGDCSNARCRSHYAAAMVQPSRPANAAKRMRQVHTLSFCYRGAETEYDLTASHHTDFAEALLNLLRQMLRVFGPETIEDGEIFEGLAAIVKGECVAHHGDAASGTGSVTVHRFERRDFSTPESNFDLVYTVEEVEAK